MKRCHRPYRKQVSARRIWALSIKEETPKEEANEAQDTIKDQVIYGRLKSKRR